MKIRIIVILMLSGSIFSSCSEPMSGENSLFGKITISGQASGHDVTGLLLNAYVIDNQSSIEFTPVLASTRFTNENNFSIILPPPPDSIMEVISNNTFEVFKCFEQANITNPGIKISNVVVFFISSDSVHGAMEKVTPYGIKPFKYVEYFFSNGATKVTGQYRNYNGYDSVTTNMDLDIKYGWNIISHEIVFHSTYYHEYNLTTGDRPECEWRSYIW